MALAASAQTFQAQLTGLVHDASGAGIPNAKVTATNVATNVSSTTQTNESGLYRFPALPPSRYRISASMAGFKTQEQGPITLAVNEPVELNITLQVGDAAERMEVTAAPEALQTQTASVGQVVNTRTIEGLPLNVRDPLALIGLTPGVTFGANFGNGGGQELGRNFFKSDFNVGGGRSGSQELLLDGAANTTPDINRGIINPPVDSVQEFKVQANSYDAEFGRTSGGVINVITKSGGNEIHGVLYDFERHSYIEANNWFNNASGLKNPSFKRHQFGANAGGPIKKNKTFFFADYEGLRQGFPVTFVTTVPTALQRQGDFSQTRGPGGQPIIIYDPATVETLANGQRQRSPFAGNIIPANRIDPVSAKLAALFPLPNQAGDALGQNNYARSAGSTIDTDKWDARVDHSFGENTRIFGRYSQQKDVRVVPAALPPPVGGGRNTTDTYHQAMVDLTHVFSPTWLLTAQASFSRALATQYGLSRGFDFASLGFPSNITSIAVDQVPGASISDIPPGIANAAGDSFTQYQPRNVWAMRAGLNNTRGSHNLKYGVDYRILDFNEGQNTAPSGTYSFTRAYTQGPIANAASTLGGFGFADFLLGTPASGTFRQLMPISTQGLYTAFYLQDDWHVSRKLTVNLGVRWDIQRGDREKWGRIAWFDPNAQSPIAQAAGLPNLKGALRWVNGDNGRNQQETPKTDIAPRIGIAYKFTDRVVFRTGYGLFYVPRNIQGNGLGAISAFRDTPMVTSLDNNITPLNRISNPFPQGVLPALNDRDPGANIGAAIQAPFYENKSGYVQLWSATLQWEMPGKVVMQAMYWGNKGTGLIAPSQNINQLPDQYLSLGNALNDQVTNPFFGVITAGALSGRTISRRQSLLPYPQYSGDAGVQRVFAPFGNSNYNGATLQAERRLAEHLTFLLGYTWSKAIDDLYTPIDAYNRRLSRALSAFDTPHQFIGSWVYALPLGKGRMVDLGPANTILGNWDLSGIVRVQSGQPVAISTPSVNIGQSAKLDNPTITRWFDTTVFRTAAPFTFGNVGPRLPDVRTDFTRNVDLVMVKKFPFHIGEREITPQFRAECYNLFNTPQFAAPNGTVTSGQFGTVTRQANTSRQFQFALKIAF